MASMPANSDTLAGLPSYDTLTNSIHDSDDFMSRNARVLNAWNNPLLCKRITVTNSTSLHLDSYRSRTWLREFTFHNLKWSVRLRDLNCAHCWHNSSVVVLERCQTNPLDPGAQAKIENLRFLDRPAVDCQILHIGGKSCLISLISW